MKVNVFVKECLTYAVGIVMSCGPSQIFGLVKGALDSVKLLQVNSKLKQLGKLKEQLENGSLQLPDLKTRNLKSISKKLHRIVSEEKLDGLEAKQKILEDIDAICERNIVKDKGLWRSLAADGLALIPFCGALLSWREHTGYWGAKARKGVAAGLEQLLERHPKQISEALYPIRGKSFEEALNGVSEAALDRKVNEDAERAKASVKKVKIPVRFPGRPARTLSAHHMTPTQGNPQGPTVVLFHGNVMVGQEMSDLAAYYATKGFNVLMPTLGGYPGSPGVQTSEESSYCDVEAIKQYLQNQGVTEAAYHGLSIGGSLAFQAAAGESNATELTTLFVVADQTFSNSAEVSGRLVENAVYIGKALGKGFARAALPKGKPVHLGGGKVVKTDGLDNLSKAKKLSERNIPLVTIGCSEDFLMRSRLDESQNFNHDLYQARYSDRSGRRKGGLDLTLDGDHCTLISYRRHTKQRGKFSKFIRQIRKKTQLRRLI